MRRATATDARPGVAALWAVIVLTVVVLLMATFTARVVSSRRLGDRHENQAQAAWLARSGVEVAAARLLRDPDGYDGETLEPTSGAKVTITVERAKDDKAVYRVESVARYPAEGHAKIERVTSRHFRRSVADGRARLEVVAGE